MKEHLITAIKFPPGQVVATPGALELLERRGKDALEFLCRHMRGDWGDMCDEDKATNEHALENDLRLFSAYEIEGGKLWLITEWNRSATTLLRPDEY